MNSCCEKNENLTQNGDLSHPMSATTEDTYCGYPILDKPYINDIYFCSMRWTNVGVALVPLFVLVGVILSSFSLWYGIIAGIISYACIFSITIRFTQALYSQGIWLPKKLLYYPLYITMTSTLIGWIDLIAYGAISSTLNIILDVITAGSGILWSIAGYKLKNTYDGKMSHLGKSFLVVGLLISICSVLSIIIHKDISIGQTNVDDIPMIILIIFAFVFAFVTLGLIWPFRIMVRMFKLGDLVASGKIKRTISDYVDYDYQYNKNLTKCFWVIGILIVIYLIVKLVTFEMTKFHTEIFNHEDNAYDYSYSNNIEENTQDISYNDEDTELEYDHELSTSRSLTLIAHNGLVEPLPPQSGNNYNAKNLVDGDVNTAWAINLTQAGYEDGDFLWGPSISLDANRIDAVEIVNGYAKSPEAFKNNTRASWIMIYRPVAPDTGNPEDEDILYKGPLKDTPYPQRLKINKRYDNSYPTTELTIAFSNKQNDKFYHGEKWNDLCISEIRIFGSK